MIEIELDVFQNKFAVFVNRYICAPNENHPQR